MHNHLRDLGVRKVLVTGGAGFLGPHLCEGVVEAGHEVLWVDNYFTAANGMSRICSCIQGVKRCVMM